MGASALAIPRSGVLPLLEPKVEDPNRHNDLIVSTFHSILLVGREIVASEDKMAWGG